MNNQQLTQEIISILKQKLEKEYPPGNTKRDARAKSLGLVKSKFIIDSHIDKKYQVGIFKPNHKYTALLRFSNSLTDDDKKKDIRGLAIKILGVDGKKVLDDEKYTQDIILVSTEIMPIKNLQMFYDVIYYTFKFNPIILGLKFIKEGNVFSLVDTAKSRKHHTSPLDIEYFSTTPYGFSNEVVKYKIVPKSSYKSKLPKKLTSNYLSENMQKHLNNNKAVFDFYVQFKTDDTMPINDASIKWNEEKSPYIKLATIEIDPQVFTTKERENISENLSFSPDHSLIEHKPIGDLNEGRVEIYKEMSLFRHQRNNQKIFEANEDTIK